MSRGKGKWARAHPEGEGAIEEAGGGLTVEQSTESFAAAGDKSMELASLAGLARLDSKRALTNTMSLHVMGKVAKAEELVGHGFSTVVLRRALCGGQICELRSGERDLGEREGVRGV